MALPGKGKAKTRKQIRSEKGLRNIDKRKESFPEIAQWVIDSSDIILEILDARFIEDTRNYKAEEEIKKQRKKLIYVINKIDLVNNPKTDEFPRPYVLFSCKEYKGSQKLRERIKDSAKELIKERRKEIDTVDETSEEKNKQGEVSKRKEKIIVGVLGYPNIGKSSIINLLTGKNAAKTAAEAGVTKGIQKVKLTKDIALLDTPGVISEEEYSNPLPHKVSQHAKTGSRTIGKVKEPEVAVDGLLKDFKEQILSYYDISLEEQSEEKDEEKRETEIDTEEFLEKLGRRKSILKKGNEVDTDKVARLVLKDWQEGNIKV